jgi:hypothetical protein
MENGHPSYAHSASYVTHIHWVKFKAKNCAHILHQCVGSSLWVEPKNDLKTSKNYINLNANVLFLQVYISNQGGMKLRKSSIFLMVN